MLSALLAGVLMFLAPCTLPLVPAFIAVLSGVDGKVKDRKRCQVFLHACSFLLGFGLTFTVLGLLLGLFGSVIGGYRSSLTTLSGLAVISFGVLILAKGHVPLFDRLSIFTSLPVRNVSTFSAAFIGASIAIGWSPCIGPVLASVFLLAAAKATALEGAFLLLIFCVGFSIPFLIVAYFYDKITFSARSLRYIAAAVRYLGGLLLVYIGILLLTDSLGMLAGIGESFFRFFGIDFILNYY